MKQSLSRLFGINDKNKEQEETMQEEKEEIHQIPVSHIVPNEYQPRTIFQEDKIDELAQTIKTHGIIQPIVVRKKGDKYEIIAGERRWRAVKKLNLETIPAIIKQFNDSQTASVALIENLQREELTAIEEARAYAQLIELHQLTQESLAQRLGKGQSTIANKLRLLQLPDEVQEAILKRQITERHARALIRIKDSPLLSKVLNDIIENGLNVKQTEELIKKIKGENEQPKKKKKPIRKGISKDIRLAMNTIRKSVDMVTQTGMNIDTEEEDHEDYYQFIIKIRKK